MSVIYGNPIITNGGVKLNIDYGATPPSDTTKLWVPLATKPSAVECSPVLKYGRNYIANVDASIPSNQKNGPFVSSVGTKLYILGGNSSGDAGKSVCVYDTETNEFTQLGAKLVAIQMYGACVSIGSKIYCLSGYYDGTVSGRSQVFDTDTNIATEIRRMLSSRSFVSACAVGTDIYVSGGILAGGGYEYNFIKYDTLTNQYENTTLNPYAIHGAMASVGDKIYYFGGSNSDGNTPNCWRFDTKTNSKEQISKLPHNTTYGGSYMSAMSVGSNIYIFGGDVGPTYNHGVTNKVYKYDTLTDQYELVANMAEAKCQVGLAKIGFDVYAVGGSNAGGTTGSWLTDIQRLVTDTPLTNNHLFLQEDYGYDGLWTALKSKDTDFKVKVINAYLGDSNNIAQLTNAYLYDTASNQWKSLSGESYVADMQNALNILGVN